MKHLLYLTFLLLFLTSCKKDELAETGCRISKVMLYDGTGAPDDEAILSYSGDNVSEVALSDVRYTITYNGEGRVVRRTFFRPNATSPFRYDTLIYGADRTLSLLERYNLGVGGGFQRTDSVRLAFSNGQLQERRQYSVPPFSFGGPLQLQGIFRYTYAGNNITRLQREHFSNGAPSFTVTDDFEADALPNYYNGQGAQFYLVDPTMAQGLLETVHSVMMANNIVRVRSNIQQPPLDYPLTYLTNSQGLLSEVRINGTPLVAYAYECR
ncbi:hypothetical protein [Flaviaesturariibacter amylovorans]|uniref:DUF4595 domain-containing protein n=1 Tax=Flaviaesturariibacter amylovorans TaxID=1084520 RepID=A0ABP8GLZ5_9BACT